MEEQVLEKIESACDDLNVNNIVISFSGSEIVLLAKYIERLEEKEIILNRLLGKDTIININNVVYGKENWKWKKEH